MTNSYISRKEQIIITTIEIINELGINRLSTREIAKRLGTSDAALYRHYKSKENILLAVLDYYAKFDSAIINTIYNNNLAPIDGILFFVQAYGEYYENYPQISAVLSSFNDFLYEEVLAKKLNEIISSRVDFLTNIVLEGQRNGQINSIYNYEYLVDAIIGTTTLNIIKWRLCNYDFSLKERLVSITDALLKVVKSETASTA